jgi:hypothetical protein
MAMLRENREESESSTAFINTCVHFHGKIGKYFCSMREHQETAKSFSGIRILLNNNNKKQV